MSHHVEENTHTRKHLTRHPSAYPLAPWLFGGRGEEGDVQKKKREVFDSFFVFRVWNEEKREEIINKQKEEEEERGVAKSKRKEGRKG